MTSFRLSIGGIPPDRIDEMIKRYEEVERAIFAIDVNCYFLCIGAKHELLAIRDTARREEKKHMVTDKFGWLQSEGHPSVKNRPDHPLSEPLKGDAKSIEDAEVLTVDDEWVME